MKSLSKEQIQKFIRFISSLNIPKNPYDNMSDCSWAWRNMNETEKDTFAVKFLFIDDINREPPICKIQFMAIMFIYFWNESIN